MYQPDLLRAGFSEVVGYLQANVPTIGGIPIPQITAPLTTSESGMARVCGGGWRRHH